MSKVVVSRGLLDRSVLGLLRAVPLVQSPTVALSVCSGRIPGFGRSQAGRRPPVSDLYEEIMRTGNFTNESLRTVAQRKPQIVVVAQESGRPGSLARLASDGVCLLTRAHTPVLLLPAVCSISQTGKILVGSVYGGNLSADHGSCVSGLVDLTSGEVIVLVVASPPRRSFQLILAGSRSRRTTRDNTR